MPHRPTARVPRPPPPLAQRHFDEALPVAVTLEEAAPWLGTTYDALRKAVHRAGKERMEDFQTPYARPTGRVLAPTPLPVGDTFGRWFDPRELRAWYKNRPGRWPVGSGR